MSAKSIRFHELARYKMFASANMLADAVKVTLRSTGRAGSPAAIAEAASGRKRARAV